MTYDIIATLGPASSTEDVWQDMVAAGATQFRLNSSHLSTGEVITWVERLRSFFDRQRLVIPVVVDLQGSKWRLGQLPAGKLTAGQPVTLIAAGASTSSDVLPVAHTDFFAAAPQSSRELRLNDAKVVLEIETIAPDAIHARVTQGGPIASNKGITFAETDFRSEGLSNKDRSILHATRQYPFVRYAISYVKNAQEMAAYRKQIGPTLYLIAKLERRPAVEEARLIALESDELWLCRGDLGAELGLVEMAKAAYSFSETVRNQPIPVMLAGQVLEHMTEKPTPTRSEVVTLYAALMQGFQGFVLSDETAIGRYPIGSCRIAAQFNDVIFD